MSNYLAKLIFSLSVLSLLTINAWAADIGTFQGLVTDAKGQPVKGAEVRIVGKNKKIYTAKTDAKGHYVSAAMDSGNYKVDLVVASAIKASLKEAKLTPGKPTELNFDIKAGKKRRVWVQELGSHLGHWVDVDDENGAAGTSNIVRGNSSDVRRMQERGMVAPPPNGR